MQTNVCVLVKETEVLEINADDFDCTPSLVANCIKLWDASRSNKCELVGDPPAGASSINAQTYLTSLLVI